jgi:hypothetical protein
MPTTPSSKHLNRIAWESAADGGYNGHIRGRAHGYDAKIQLFEIVLALPLGETVPFYRLKHRLPFAPVTRQFQTARVAQQHAERFLLLAVELLGFVPATPRTRVEHKKTFRKTDGTVVRIGAEEPKFIVAETADYVVIEVFASSGKPLGEQAIPKQKFEEHYDRMEG